MKAGPRSSCIRMLHNRNSTAPDQVRSGGFLNVYSAGSGLQTDCSMGGSGRYGASYGCCEYRRTPVRNPDFVENILTMLDRTRANLQNLKLELTWVCRYCRGPGNGRATRVPGSSAAILIRVFCLAGRSRWKSSNCCCKVEPGTEPKFTSKRGGSFGAKAHTSIYKSARKLMWRPRPALSAIEGS